jgi:asparagine synthase (glutamine-hydrolysing)
MCGITGIFNLKKEKEISPSIVEKMLETIKHRGPDGRGFYFDNKVGLGFCRLAINDLSERANQPMTNEDGSIIFAVNGEIYNFKELRLELQKKGHLFKSRSDSETVGHLYEEFGLNFVQKLNGMFAIVIWDIKNGNLILARDRLGIKPLYYSIAGGKFIFASEIKAIVEHPSFRKEVDFKALDLYFSYCTTLPLFKNIFSISPGEILITSLNGKMKKIKYWHPSFLDEFSVHYSFKKAKSRLFELINQSLERQFLADVPSGFFLSGGIDSSGLLGLSRSIFPARIIPTFTLGFKSDSGFLLNKNDVETSRRLAKIFKTDHHEFIISAKDYIESLDKLIEAAASPLALSYVYYFIAKKARKYVKSIIAGDGGDELFAGYRHHYGMLISPQSNRWHWHDRHFLVFPQRIKNNLYVHHLLKQQLRCDNRHEALHLFLEKISRSLKTQDVINQNSNIDLLFRLPEYALWLLDFLSMYNSVEARVPYLDDCLVDFAIRLPGKFKFKLKGNITKFILKDILKDFIPLDILQLPKSPFQSPLPNWFPFYFKRHIMPTLCSKRLKAHGFFDTAFVSALISNYKSHKKYPYLIWTLYVFQLWWEKYFG